MFQTLDFFNVASQLARHSATRQSIVAENIANADTPDYRAKDIETFSAIFSSEFQKATMTGMKTSRPGHIERPSPDLYVHSVSDKFLGAASPSGNTVSLEAEMVKASEVKHRHELALATYRGGLDLLRTAISAGQ